MISKDPTNNKLDFSCQSCDRERSFAEMSSISNDAESFITETEIKQGVLDYLEYILNSISASWKLFDYGNKTKTCSSLWKHFPLY